ncbi:endoribonuclease Dicer-like isoform X2 [Anneissia japonica]|nr:endoribonuclease Dicer-like isoform X2 [Anneissia japonica]
MDDVIPLASSEPPVIRRGSADASVGDTTFTPRTYQVELLEAALKQNTIVCLQTGTGKTFIAVMLIKELAHQIRKAFDEGGKRTLFLVNTVPLVNQQAEVIKKHTNLEVGKYVGAMNVDLWQKDQWLEEFQNNQVLVMTAQIFKDILQHGYMGLSKVNLMIFDECHHAVKNHPYREIMRFFDICPKKDYPRVMGLTASILNGKCEPRKLEDRLCDLELTLRSAAETANDVAAMSRYGTRPKEYIVHCDVYKDESGLFQEINDILMKTLDFFSNYGGEVDGERDRDPRIQPKQAISECHSTLYTIGPLGVKIVVPMLVAELEKLEKHEFMELNRLFIQTALTTLKWVKMLCDEKIKNKKDQTSLEFVPHKVVRLLEVLKEFRPDEEMMVDGANSCAGHRESTNGKAMPLDTMNGTIDPDEDSNDEDYEPPCGPAFVEGDLCGVVFVEKRYTAAVLNKLLRHIQKSDSNLQHVKSDYITGQGRASLSNRSIQTEVQFKKQEEILRRFRRHETNLLFATSVIEEGVDVPRCNVVVRFDLPKHYRSYTQSKGRARAADSFYIMLTDVSESEEFQEDLHQFREIDKILQKRCHNREPHTEEKMDMHIADNLLPPYMPRKEEGAPRVSMTSAISLVNRYCAKLPGDSFTHLTPQCKVVQVNQGNPPVYQATLCLPINAPNRDPIVGVEMPRKKYAEMAVALKTIEMLHKQGELSDRLLPIEKNAFLESENFGYKSFEEEYVEGQARPGTTKRRQYYNKQVARCLEACHPDAKKPCYLYAIIMETKELLPNVLNTRGRKLHRPEDSSQGFGILTSKPIPRIPGFPIYTRSGQIAVTISVVKENMQITEVMVKHCERFHCCMFSEVLRLQKGNLSFEPTSAPSAYLIVPLISDGGGNENIRIDSKFLEKISRQSGALDMPSILPEFGSKKFEFVADHFEGAVVAPIYRNVDQPQRFYVAKICDDQTVSSDFPSEKYRTFTDYYFEQYDIEVTNFRQPLLDVDSMASRLNLLTPRYLNHKGKALPISTGEKKAASQKQQLLVPEFCYIYPIDAALWRKCICLPSILYRMNSLLIAEELRMQVSVEAGIGVKTFGLDYPFPNLTFGWEGLNLDGPSTTQLGGKQNGLNEHEKETSISVDQNKHSVEVEEGEIDPLEDQVVMLNLPEKQNLLNGFEEGEIEEGETKEKLFLKASLEDFDNDPASCIGASPATILQALTMSNANDGFNLERLEMLGDSFLKQAVTIYLYCMYPKRHEGKLSFMRSKQVSNFNLYCLGKEKELPFKMIMTLFDPASNWLPPCYNVEEIAAVDPEKLISEEEPSFPIGQWDPNEVNTDTYEYADSLSDLSDDDDFYSNPCDYRMSSFSAPVANTDSVIKSSFSLQDPDDIPKLTYSLKKPKNPAPDLPYEIHTQQGLSDKSIADCIEALIGCYLVSCGSRNTLLFMSWLGLKVLPTVESEESQSDVPSPIDNLFGKIQQPPSPFLSHVPHAQEKLAFLLNGFDQFEEGISYSFKDKSYLLQAFTHASYHKNVITDCYQRLEFLGDAILDYLITCHLYNNHQQLSPGALTDMRSALVNNNIFASLAVKFEYHKYFKAFSPELFSIVDRFVEFLNKKDEIQGMDSQLTMDEADEEEEGEDIEVPKALGDIFESVAGAIYLDSGMSLQAVWDVYYKMMRPQIEKFACELPISPVRELLEMEPETAKFGKPVRTVDGKTRVIVSVTGKSGKVEWKGVGRNYRIAKATAARRALRHLKNSKK